MTGFGRDSNLNGRTIIRRFVDDEKIGFEKWKKLDVGIVKRNAIERDVDELAYPINPMLESRGGIWDLNKLTQSIRKEEGKAINH
jgi:hypothetical protein